MSGVNGTDGSVTVVRGPQLRRAMALTTVAWMFGAVWLNSTSGTPLANFAGALNASEFQKGVMSALPFLASLLSLPASLLIERVGKRRRIFLWGLYFQRLMWIAMAILPYWLVKLYGMTAAAQAMNLFLLLFFIMHAGQAIGGPAWVSWMADLVPEQVRGKYFGTRRQWGVLPSVPAALFVGWLLDRYGQGDPLTVMYWCGLVFVGAAIFGLVDIHLFHYVPDIPKKPQPGLSLFKAWRDPLTNRRFLWFAGCVATMLFGISFMGQFVTFYIIEHLGEQGSGKGINALTQMMVIIVPAIAQLLVLRAWGKAADKMGKKPVLVLAGLGLVPVALAWCFVTRDMLWLGYVVSGLGAALWAGVEVANFNLVLQWSGSADDENEGRGGTGYMAVNAVIINVAGCAGGLCAGWVAQTLRDMQWQWVTAFKTFTFYDVLFVMSALLRLAAIVIFAPMIDEPDAAPTRQTLRFMTANIYNNLATAAMQPLRFLRSRRKDSWT